MIYLSEKESQIKRVSYITGIFIENEKEMRKKENTKKKQCRMLRKHASKSTKNKLNK